MTSLERASTLRDGYFTSYPSLRRAAMTGAKDLRARAKVTPGAAPLIVGGDDGVVIVAGGPQKQTAQRVVPPRPDDQQVVAGARTARLGRGRAVSQPAPDTTDVTGLLQGLPYGLQEGVLGHRSLRHDGKREEFRAVHSASCAAHAKARTAPREPSNPTMTRSMVNLLDHTQRRRRVESEPDAQWGDCTGRTPTFQGYGKRCEATVAGLPSCRKPLTKRGHRNFDQTVSGVATTMSGQITC